MNKEALKKELKALGINCENNRIKKSDALKVLATGSTVSLLVRTLYTMFGEKRYLHDLETLLNDRLKELTPEEERAIGYLVKDLMGIEDAWDRGKRLSRQSRP